MYADLKMTARAPVSEKAMFCAIVNTAAAIKPENNPSGVSITAVSILKANIISVFPPHIMHKDSSAII